MSAQANANPTSAAVPSSGNVSAAQTSAATNSKTTTQTYKEFTPTVRNKEELTSQLLNLSDDGDLWQLTYLLHSRETFRLVSPTEDEKISFRYNDICVSSSARSRLENITRSFMKGLSNADWHNCI